MIFSIVARRMRASRPRTSSEVVTKLRSWVSRFVNNFFFIDIWRIALEPAGWCLSILAAKSWSIWWWSKAGPCQCGYSHPHRAYFLQYTLGFRVNGLNDIVNLTGYNLKDINNSLLLSSAMPAWASRPWSTNNAIRCVLICHDAPFWLVFLDGYSAL